MARVELHHVSKQFDKLEVVHDVNLDVQDKEFMVLLGPSGCGKTTTLRMIAGLEDLSAGNIIIDGRDVSDVPPKDRDIAMVFQNYALYPHMTVFENMAFGLKLRKVPKDEIKQRVEAAAEILGIAPYLHRKPKQLSGGQRQRVALGRAIVREPKVFLMDEPLSNLDAKLRSQTRVELKRLHARIGATIIYVTHDQTEAMTMGTRIVVMRDGVVHQVDTPEGIYSRPNNMFVATFVGTPGMNLLRGEMEEEDGTTYFRLGSQRAALPQDILPLLEGLSGRGVVLGARPEDLHVGERIPGGMDLRAEVRVLEPLGHENMIDALIESQPVQLRTANDVRVEPGQQIELSLDPKRIHLFDPDTEDALGRRETVALS